MEKKIANEQIKKEIINYIEKRTSKKVLEHYTYFGNNTVTFEIKFDSDIEIDILNLKNLYFEEWNFKFAAISSIANKPNKNIIAITYLPK